MIVNVKDFETLSKQWEYAILSPEDTLLIEGGSIDSILGNNCQCDSNNCICYGGSDNCSCNSEAKTGNNCQCVNKPSSGLNPFPDKP